MELIDAKKVLWYNWRHDYVLKQSVPLMPTTRFRWKCFIALLFCVIPRIIMQGDWIGVLFYAVDVAIISALGAHGIEVDIG